MKRRFFLVVAGGVSLGQRSVRAQPVRKPYRLAHISTTQVSEQTSRDIVLKELARLGFREGGNLVFDARVGNAEELPDLVRQLLKAGPDAIIAIGSSAVKAAATATQTVPVVMFADDPITLGYAENYARPGGNVTGIANMLVELHGKRLALLLEALPNARRIATLVRVEDPSRDLKLSVMRSAASQAGVELAEFLVTRPSEYEEAFARMRAGGAQGVVIAADPEFYRDEATLAALAVRHGLASTCEWASMAKAGCLIGYGPQTIGLRIRLAQIVARIFQGARPAEIPIERAALFDLAVNLATARALGVALPPTLLLRADQVID